MIMLRKTAISIGAASLPERYWLSLVLYRRFYASPDGPNGFGVAANLHRQMTAIKPPPYQTDPPPVSQETRHSLYTFSIILGWRT
jgi:hypothetical protein